ncbi:Fmp27_GFWDK domain-containing protein [Lamellibrachia satsuma]|nr:Fmp27_GFWDK domain-containing protein [Lamellibrachia satsuma]
MYMVLLLFLSNWLMHHLSKKLSIMVNTQQVTVVVAKATCSGVNAGFTSSKLSLCINPEPPGTTVQLRQRDVHIDFELVSLYCSLNEPGLSTSDLSPRQHRWNTLVYLDMFIVNMNQLTSDMCIEGMADSLQVELSTTGLAVLGKLTSALMADLWPRGRGAHLAGVEGGQTVRPRRPAALQLQLKCNSLNVFTCTDTGVYSMLRVDSISCQHRPVDTTVDINGTHVTYSRQADKFVALLKSQDLPEGVAHVNVLQIIHKPSTKRIQVRLQELVHVSWTHAFHLCVRHVWQDLIYFKHSLIESPSVIKVEKSKDWPLVSVSLNADLKLSAQLSKHHRVSVETNSLTVETDDKHVCIQCPVLGILADQHHIFTLHGLSLERCKHCPELVVERSAIGTLTVPTNTAWVFSLDTLHIVFPHAYKFADCLEEVKNLNKWLKLVHKIEKKPFTEDSPLPADLCISVQNVVLQLSDDPLEVKLGDNYQLMRDEHLENEKRLLAMDKKIQELRRKHGTSLRYSIDRMGILQTLTSLKYFIPGMGILSPQWTNMDFFQRVNFIDNYNVSIMFAASKLKELCSCLSTMSSGVYIECCIVFAATSKLEELYSSLSTRSSGVYIECCIVFAASKLEELYSSLSTRSSGVYIECCIVFAASKLEELYSSLSTRSSGVYIECCIVFAASKLEELYSSLSTRSSGVYIERCRQLYTSSARRTKLFTWTMTHLRIVALADVSLHGHDTVVRHMQATDKDSPYPEEGLEFTTLWCRQVSASVGLWTLQLRDYPQPLLEVETMHVWGILIGAEQMASNRATRSCLVEIDQPWGNMTVERRMPPLKFYHDLSCDVSVFNMAYGACWEPCFAQYNLALNLVNQPTLDPSAPLAFWDKSRLLLHGRLTMSVQMMSWLYHASQDPYNTTELMDWTWSNLILDWTAGRIIV